MTRDLSLPERMDYASLEAFHAELKDAQGEDIALDGSQVAHLGSCGLQLLYSAWKSWERDGHSLSVTNPSEKFLSHLEILGGSPELLKKAGDMA